ncbi:hypothetical protein CROQUDRAFT_45339 [Cronartium quercuum f. sp. fusiforme G11]|uniref:Uncharacterized protein n=1 Tax=Cronartium quercuum f. sp. fusiforme G11 TaxID=708437 RepID=A0A9P6TAZ9_9BASI|nr:hypothetical protein CROQUDRAFT_45339 [Cronartium quercuum f. sp. fusiforme G11]
MTPQSLSPPPRPSNVSSPPPIAGPSTIPNINPIAALTFNPRSELIIYFSPTTDPNQTPMPIPIELSNVLKNEEWNQRTKSIFNLLSKFVWSKILRIYLLIVILLTLLGPVLVNLIVSKIFFAGLLPLKIDATNEEILERVSIVRKAHLINFSVSLAFMILIWAPYHAYKLMGRKRLRALLQTFSNTDSSKGNMSALHWSVSRTSTLQRSTNICIQLPIALISARQPSLFSTEAYLPSYLQKESTLPPKNHQIGVTGTESLQQPAPAYEYPPPDTRK